MADRIKGITIEIDGETKGLSQALKGVNASIRETQSQLRDVERLLKMDPGNTELLKQKQQALAQAIEQTKQKLEQEKVAMQQLGNAPQTAEVISRQQALAREIIATEQHLNSLTSSFKNFGSVAAQQVAAAGNTIKSVGEKMRGVGDVLTDNVTRPLVNIGKEGAESFYKVDGTMSLVNATMQNSTEEANNLNAAMKDAASNSVFGMDDAAKATLNFARAGLDAKESASMLGPAMNLAAGEGGNLDTVSKGLIGTINGFHDSFDKAGHYADVFAAACNASQMDVNSLSDSVGIAVPIFNSAGYSVEDLTLAMGTMGNANIDANKAATALKSSIARLIDPPKTAAQSLEQLGFGTEKSSLAAGKLVKAQKEVENKQADLTAKTVKYNEVLAKYGAGSSQAASASAAMTKAQNALELAQMNVNELMQETMSQQSKYGNLMVDSTGKIRPFREMIGLLRKSMEGLTEAQKLEAMATIFGKNHVSSMMALVDAAPEKYDKLADAIDNCTGTTDRMSKAMMSGFAGSLNQLKSSIDVAVYEIGQSLAPYILKAADCIKRLVEAWRDLTPAQKDMIVQIGLVVAAVGPLLKVFGSLVIGLGEFLTYAPKVISAIQSVGTAFRALTAIMMANPYAIVAAAIAALVAAFIYLWNTNEDFREFWIDLWETIKTVTLKAVDAVVGFFTDKIPNAMDSLSSKMDRAWKEISAPVKSVWNSIANDINGAWDTINKATEVAVKFLQGLIRAGWEAISGLTSQIWGLIAAAVDNALSALGISICPTLDSIRLTIEGAWTSIQEMTSNAWQGICNVASEKWKELQDVVIGAAKSLQAKLSPILDGIRDFLSKMWEGISREASAAWDEICDTVSSKVDSLSKDISKAWEGISKEASAAWGKISNAISSKIDSISKEVSKKWSGIKNAVSDTMNSVVNVVSNKWKEASSATSSALESIQGKASSKLNAVNGVVVSAMQSIKDAIGNGWKAAKESVGNILKGLLSDVDSAFDDVRGAVNDLVSDLKDAFDFEWELPHIKLPHIKISGKFSLDPPEAPTFSVDWYRKAMNGGMILDGATIFGMSGGTLLGGGEAGKEAVVGVGSLRSMIMEAVSQQTGSIVQAIQDGLKSTMDVTEQVVTVPVYIGSDKLDTAIAKAQSRIALRSGR